MATCEPRSCYATCPVEYNRVACLNCFAANFGEAINTQVIAGMSSALQTDSTFLKHWTITNNAIVGIANQFIPEAIMSYWEEEVRYLVPNIFWNISLQFKTEIYKKLLEKWNVLYEGAELYVDIMIDAFHFGKIANADTLTFTEGEGVVYDTLFTGIDPTLSRAVDASGSILPYGTRIFWRGILSSAILDNTIALTETNSVDLMTLLLGFLIRRQIQRSIENYILSRDSVSIGDTYTFYDKTYILEHNETERKLVFSEVSV